MVASKAQPLHKQVIKTWVNKDSFEPGGGWQACHLPASQWCRWWWGSPLRPPRPHTQSRRSAQLQESARNVSDNEGIKSVEDVHLVLHGVLPPLPAGHGKTLSWGESPPSVSLGQTKFPLWQRSEQYQPVGGHQSRHLISTSSSGKTWDTFFYLSDISGTLNSARSGLESSQSKMELVVSIETPTTYSRSQKSNTDLWRW